MKVYMAFAFGKMREPLGCRESEWACACQIFNEDDTLRSEFYDHSGPFSGNRPGQVVTTWVERVVGMVKDTPQNEMIAFYISKDAADNAKYVINMTVTRLGDFYLSGGKTNAGKPVPYWDHWRRIAEFTLSRNPKPTWQIGLNDPRSIFVSNLARTFVI